MRMWMTEPDKMCRKHLLGEHVECHMFLGTLKRKMQINGYIEKNCLEPESLLERHQKLSEEMVRRGYNHKSPLDEPDISYLPKHVQVFKVDVDAARKELTTRCEECRREHVRLDSE